MPIYEYACNSCKNKFELMRPFSRSAEGADCPRCRKRAERILSACYSQSTNESGVVANVAGTGSSCSSCGGGSCSTCGH